jgi:MFS transporter, AAHS family, 4-hydroxybenzoate transporter
MARSAKGGKDRETNMAQTQVVNIQTFLNAHRFSSFQWVVFGLCFVIVVMDGFDTAAIGFIAPSLVQEWGVTRPELGPVLSAALFGLAAGALSSGPIADRLGRKIVLAVSVLVFGAACLGSSFAANLQQLTILRFLTGVGLGAAMPNAVTLVSEFCPDRWRATLTKRINRSWIRHPVKRCGVHAGSNPTVRPATSRLVGVENPDRRRGHVGSA